MRRICLRPQLAARLALALGLAASASVAVAGDNCVKQVPSLIDKSLIIVAARITEVGPAPGFWGGVLPAIQTVGYDVLATYKGKISDKQISVDHNVIEGSRLSEKRPPGLSKKYFTAGNEVVLFLHTPKLDIGGECAIQPRTTSLDKQIQDSLHVAN